MYAWEVKHERNVKHLVRLAKKALKKIAGINIMGGCSACGTGDAKLHTNDCIVPQMRRTIKEIEAVKIWR